MNFLTTMAVAASITATSLADSPASNTDMLAYHQVAQPSLAYTSLPASIGTAMPLQPIEAMMAPTVTAALPAPNAAGDPSMLKGTASIVGTIGMLILLLRRRPDTA